MNCQQNMDIQIYHFENFCAMITLKLQFLPLYAARDTSVCPSVSQSVLAHPIAFLGVKRRLPKYIVDPYVYIRMFDMTQLARSSEHLSCSLSVKKKG